MLTFVVSALIGGVAIHADALIVSDARGYAHAVLTALVGAVVWTLLAPVPLIGGLLALVAWVAVVRWRYPGGWLRAGATGVAAWAAAVVILAALDLFGVGARRAGRLMGGYRKSSTILAGMVRRGSMDRYDDPHDPLTIHPSRSSHAAFVRCSSATVPTSSASRMPRSVTTPVTRSAGVRSKIGFDTASDASPS